jgi:REP element-mobilizing transposase RayT
VTIVTSGRDPYFGKISKDEIHLTNIGKMVELEWNKTPQLRPDMNIKLDAFCVMPNHFHAIIVIGRNRYNSYNLGGGIVERGVETQCIASLQPSDEPSSAQQPNCIKNRFGPQSHNLPSIIRGFKSAITTYARKCGEEFGWQSRYHEHIIQNKAEFHKIRQYISSNVANWKDDRFYV